VNRDTLTSRYYCETCERFLTEPGEVRIETFYNIAHYAEEVWHVTPTGAHRAIKIKRILRPATLPTES
jgi:hypothetical protein